LFLRIPRLSTLESLVIGMVYREGVEIKESNKQSDVLLTMTELSVLILPTTKQQWEPRQHKECALILQGFEKSIEKGTRTYGGYKSQVDFWPWTSIVIFRSPSLPLEPVIFRYRYMDSLDEDKSKEDEAQGRSGLNSLPPILKHLDYEHHHAKRLRGHPSVNPPLPSPCGIRLRSYTIIDIIIHPSRGYTFRRKLNHARRS